MSIPHNLISLYRLLLLFVIFIEKSPVFSGIFLFKLLQVFLDAFTETLFAIIATHHPINSFCIYLRYTNLPIGLLHCIYRLTRPFQHISIIRIAVIMTMMD